MPNLKPTFSKLTNIFIVFVLIAIIYFALFTSNTLTSKETAKTINFLPRTKLRKPIDYNVWLIFTKVTEKSPLRYKFHNLLANILNTTSISLKFHIIIDNGSRDLVNNEISDVVSSVNKAIFYKLYDVEACARSIGDIVRVMTPHFSSKPGTYYSDALFYISLGLHRIAPQSQDRALLLDCDLYFKKDILEVFKQFDNFKPGALFGLAPELTPVYRHVLHMHKAKHKTSFGDYYHTNNIWNESHPRGFQGYNSGVVLVNLQAVRRSSEYARIIKNETVQAITSKYKFRGHLGDQDFYTLVGFEYPHLIQTLNCGFNRQLCVWWRDHGYGDVFDYYFKCKHPTVVLHGNCNTKIPK